MGKKVLFLFVDGLGLGKETGHNPLATMFTPGIHKILGGAFLTVENKGREGQNFLLLGLETGLGITGKPQSATGQASLFTGENAAAILGYHLKGFPNRELHLLLQRAGIFKKLLAEGFKVTFANAFRPQSFPVQLLFPNFYATSEVTALSQGKRHFSCSTMLNYYAGLPFKTIEDIKSGQAVFMDITNESLQQMGYSVPLISPEEAAYRLAGIAYENDLTLFEYFLTDLAAHSRDMSFVFKVLGHLDRLLAALHRYLKDDVLLLLTSDHGNIEDMCSDAHTTNPVPALIYGSGKNSFVSSAGKMDSITDITPGIISYLQRD